jgi:hypothetical protein
MTGIRMAELLLLIKVSRQLDRMERREERSFMKIQDVLDKNDVALHTLEDDDRALLAELIAIEESGGTLTDEQSAQATAALSRIEAIDQADKDALAAAQAGNTPAPGSPGEVVDNPTPPVDEGDGTADTNGF